MGTFQPSTVHNPGIRMGAGPPTGQYYVSIMGQRGMSPDGWHWGILHGGIAMPVKIKGPLVPGQRVQFKRLTGNTATQWAILKDRKLMPQHSATRGLPAATGMPGPGMVGFDAYSMHPGVRVVVPPASSFHVNPAYPFPPLASYAPEMTSSPMPDPTREKKFFKSDKAALGAALGIGIPLIIGVLALPTFVITPLILKAFVPKWSYGRRLIGGIGVTMAGGFAYKIAKTIGGKE